MFSVTKKEYSLAVPLGVASIIYAICYSLSTTFGYDTAFRSLMGFYWLEKPFYIYGANDVSWIFGPLHCYVNALAVAIFTDPNIGPRIFSALAGLLSVLPFYGVVKETFGEREAYYSSLAFPFYTVFTHLAVSANGEPLMTFLLLSALWYVIMFTKSRRISHAFLAGILMTLACSVRYEIWILLPLFGGYPLLLSLKNRDLPLLRVSLIFMAIAVIFPISWMVGNHYAVNDSLVFINQVRDLSSHALQGTRDEHIDRAIYNLTLFPGVLFLSLSPLVCLVSAVGFIKEIRRALLKNNLVVLTLLALIAYYLYAYVFTSQTVFVSRYMFLHGVFLLMCFGPGLEWIRPRLSPGSFRHLITVTFLSAAMFNVLIAYGGLSEEGIKSRLTPISPIVREPGYLSSAVSYLKRETGTGSRVMLDTKHHEQNVLYFKLFSDWARITKFHAAPEKFASAVGEVNPDILVMSPANRRFRHVFPSLPDTLVFEGSTSHYCLVAAYDLYRIYRRY